MPPAQRPRIRHGSRRRAAAWASVAVGIAVLAIVGYFVSLPSPRSPPCATPGGEMAPGQASCPISTPGPTRLIANGTTYTVPPDAFASFQFRLSEASGAVFNGSFMSALPVTVFLVLGPDFDNFSKPGAGHSSCSGFLGCFSSGEVTSGRVNCTLPLYSNTTGVQLPWVLVMANSQSGSATNVTWTSSLVVWYQVIYLVDPALPVPSSEVG